MCTGQPRMVRLQIQEMYMYSVHSTIRIIENRCLLQNLVNETDIVRSSSIPLQNVSPSWLIPIPFITFPHTLSDPKGTY